MDQGVNLRVLSLVGQVGVVMVVFILIGLVVGQWVDDKLSTAPTFTLAFILLGIGAGGWSIARLVMWALKENTGESKESKD